MATTSSTAATEAPFDAIRRRLLGSERSIQHAGNIGYTFGGGGMGMLATRFGMAAGLTVNEKSRSRGCERSPGRGTR